MVVDEGFITRVYKTSVVVWAIGCVICGVYSGWMAALGWTAGSILSAGVVYTLERFVRRTFVPGNKTAQSAFLKYYLIKSSGLMMLLAMSVLVGGRSIKFILALVVGALLLQGVMILKILGIMITGRFKG
jgi:hypothetical protein